MLNEIVIDKCTVLLLLQEMLRLLYGCKRVQNAGLCYLVTK